MFEIFLIFGFCSLAQIPAGICMCNNHMLSPLDSREHRAAERLQRDRFGRSICRPLACPEKLVAAIIGIRNELLRLCNSNRPTVKVHWTGHIFPHFCRAQTAPSRRQATTARTPCDLRHERRPCVGCAKYSFVYVPLPVDCHAVAQSCCQRKALRRHH